MEYNLNTMQSYILGSLVLASRVPTGFASTLPRWLSQRDVSPDMTCGNTGAGTAGYTCPDGLCCSQYGYCGSTTDYCEAACQASFGVCESGSGGNESRSDDGRCGPDFDDAVCGETECCSGSGYCGTTTDHCRAPDCLFDFGPACDANKTPAGTNTSTLNRSPLGNIDVGGAGIYSCENDGDVALTFDDGPEGYTSDLLDILARYNAKATFFITGINNGKGEIDDNSLQWPSVIQRMYSENHQVASHTWSHADLSAVTSSRRRDEMVKNEMAFRNILGRIPTYMRPPYSSCTESSGCQDDLAALQYHVVYFDLDTDDYNNDAPGLIQNAKDNYDDFFEDTSPSTDDALVIAHDIHEQTVHNLTEYMLQGLQTRGYRAVTVGECLGDPVANWYRQVG